MSVLSEVSETIQSKLAPLLTTANPAGPIRAISVNAFTAATDVDTVMERFKFKAPCILLSVPTLDFNTPGMPPSVGGGGASQICRVDGFAQYSLAVLTTKSGGNVDSSAPLSGEAFGSFQFHADVLDRLRVAIGGYQFQAADNPENTKANFIRFGSWRFQEGPDIQISLLTFQLQLFGFGGL